MLVLTTLIAESRVLLMKRGVPPYAGTWAPPGGYVEANESLEAAAVRETQEEVGITVSAERLLPHGIVSLPALNEIYALFLGVLDQLVAPRPCAPECTDARWFTLEEYPVAEIWAPGAGWDLSGIFRQAKTGQFHFFQRSGDSIRTFGPYCRPAED